MALFGKLQKSDEEDEDLEALRLAALQTLGSKPATVNCNVNNTVQQPLHQPIRPGRGYRGGGPRVRSGRPQIFQRHRQNSNLIAIVPVSTDLSPGIDSCETVNLGRGQNIGGSTGIKKLELPQDRYCKVESTQNDKVDTPLVSTKFSRYEDSNSDSSAEESDGEDTSDKASGSGAEEEEDPDVLMVAEDSLDKLMDELEEEMNRSDSDAPANNSVAPKTESQKRTKSSGSKSKHAVCDTSNKSQKSQGGVTTSKAVPIVPNATSKKKKESQNTFSSASKVESSTNIVSQSHVSVSPYPSNHHKDVLIERNRSTKPDVSQNSHLPPKNISQRQFSPVHNKKSRSRSPLSNPAPLLKRRSRSPSPRDRYSYSPVRSRIPRSPRRSPVPRSKVYRSPIRIARSRSRSPLRPLRSPPRKRYSRSPSWQPPSNNHLLRLSPQSRRPLSPRRSPSPPRLRLSPRRSPESRWWPSPRRSISPRPRRSPSLLPRHLSPRPRRVSVSPRRSLSPIRRRGSLSPVRRNLSPARRFSPRRNISPPRNRYSRSVSRSPDRFVPRPRQSPVGRVLHHGSPLSPKRRISRTPSPRRYISRSPFNRVPPRHSPGSRKLSPLTPKRVSPGSRRYSNSPTGRQRSLSPINRQRRSISPNRRPPGNRLSQRPQRSPTREIRRPQESRINNTRPRSRSPLPLRTHSDSDGHRSRSPRRVRSPPRRSRSPSSSISLSPSPEHGTVNNVHRYKSPLRLHTVDYRNSTAPVLHPSKESNSSRPRNVSPVQGSKEDSVSATKSSRTRSSKRRETRVRTQKRDRSKESSRRDSERSKENISILPGEKIPVLESSIVKNNADKNESTISDAKLAILEARRRKFESTGPVKPDGKKIRLKSSHPKEEKPLVQKEEIEESSQQEQTIAAKEDTPVVAPGTEKSVSTLGDSELLDTGDDFDLDLDEPFIELEGADLWSSDESNSDNEGRFKSGAKETSGSTKVTVVPFTKLLGEPKAPPRDEQSTVKHKKPSLSSRKSSSGENCQFDSKSKKASKGPEEITSHVKDSPDVKKVSKLSEKEPHERVKVESTISNPKATVSETETKVDQAEGSNDIEGEELPVKSRDGDLRAELSRRRAERLTKAGSLHESLPARLLQNAFEGVVGKKNSKRVEKEEKQSSVRKAESKKEKGDGRRVLVLKRPSVVEPRIPSISVIIPKDNKRELNPDSPPAKLPIRMRLGLPAGGSSDELLGSRRRNRKVKLKRNVMLGSRPEDKV